MSEDSALRGFKLPDEVSVTSSNYKTTLSKERVSELISRLETLQEDDETSNADKYNVIKEILEEVSEDKFQAYTDKVEIGGLEEVLRKILEGKRGSKPNEFISVLLKVLERQEF